MNNELYLPLALVIGYSLLSARLNWVLKPWRMHHFAWTVFYVLVSGLIPLALMLSLLLSATFKASITYRDYSLYGLLVLLVQFFIPLPFILLDEDRKEPTEFKTVEKLLKDIGDVVAIGLILLFGYSSITASISGENETARFAFKLALVIVLLFFGKLIKGWRDQYLHK